MYSTRIISLLTVALSLLFITQASWIDLNLLGRHAGVVAIEQRAETSSSKGPAGDAATSSSTPPPPQSTTSAPAKTTTSSEKISSTSSPDTPSSTSSDKAQSTTPPPSSTTPPPESSTSSPDDSSSSSSQEVEQQTTVIVYTTTDESGHTTAVTSSATFTPSAGLDSSTSGGSSSGMPESTRNTIIGVVVGVGGAIVLAGMALIAWRIWGRKKGQEESDGLMGYTGPEKSDVGTSGVGSTRSPFQSTLESYHAPTQVNTASNF